MTRARAVFSLLSSFALAALLTACCGTCIKDPPCKPCQTPNCCNQPNPCATPCAPAPAPAPVPMPAPAPK